MTAIVLLFLTGALLLAAEVFLPGAIAGNFPCLRGDEPIFSS